MKKLSILIVLLSSIFSLTKCSAPTDEQVVEKESIRVFSDTSIFNPIYIGRLLESPSSSGSIWNHTTLDTNEIALINMYTKVLFGPRNLLEKYAYTFYENGKEKEFSHYLYKKSTAPITHIQFSYPSSEKEQLTINNYMNNGAHPPVFFQISDSLTLQMNVLGSAASDSTYYYPNHKNPRMIISKRGNLIESVQILSPEKFTSVGFKNELQKIDSTLLSFELADKFYTYVEKGLPIETYYLDEKWNKAEKHQTWEYNSKKQLTYYEEFVLGSRTKEIELTYGDDNLPKTVIFNRQKMYFHYQFRNAK
jgi:hypothetical protein